MRARGGGTRRTRTVRALGAGAVWAGAVVFLSACAGGGETTAPPPEPPTGLDPGDHTISLSHGGLQREYQVHVPAGGTGSMPVLLAFHGGSGNAGQFKGGSAFDAHADRNGYLVVYPDGTGALGFHVWNAGECCGAAPENGIDDVGFTRAVVADLSSRHDIDQDRVYATGHSNGSMMAHRIAAEASDLLAAIAPYAGAPYFEVLGFAPSRPVPVLHIHSVDDPRALYHGGLGPPFPVTGTRNRMNPVEEQLALWVEYNGCPGGATVGPTVTGPAGSIGEGHTATLHRWSPCAGGSEVGLLKLTGAGHGWPGQELGPLQESIVGPATDVIDIEDEIWSFVSRFRR